MEALRDSVALTSPRKRRQSKPDRSDGDVWPDSLGAIGGFTRALSHLAFLANRFHSEPFRQLWIYLPQHRHDRHVTQSSSVTSGTATLTIRDTNGVLLYTRSLSQERNVHDDRRSRWQLASRERPFECPRHPELSSAVRGLISSPSAHATAPQNRSLTPAWTRRGAPGRIPRDRSTMNNSSRRFFTERKTVAWRNA